MIHVEDRGPVRWVTLDNPERKNAVPPSGWAELAGVFSETATADCRAVVVRGAGGDFCSGADLAEGRGDRTAAEHFASMDVVGRAAVALHRIPQPTIAAVDGVAVGAGMNLAVGCDIVVATERARFAEVFVRRGLTLDFGGTWLLPRLVGLAAARDLALTGRIVEAAEALRLGLVSRIVPAGDLSSTVEEIAVTLAAGAPLAQRTIKRALDRSSSMTFEESIAFESQAQAMLLVSEDFREGVAAFLAKRTARFSGR